MPVDVKICGLRRQVDVAAAIEAGARYLGFVFYPPSPRALELDAAAALAASVPDGIKRVAVLVDPDDAWLAHLCRTVPIEILQMHGRETPSRVAEIKAQTGKEVMKAVRVADAHDLAPLPAFEAVSDRILFDAKPPTDPGALPGGNGLRFDWRLLRDIVPARPWVLSGGLTVDSLADAVDLTGARAVDVSSGVERAPGDKDPTLVRAFLQRAAELTPREAA